MAKKLQPLGKILLDLEVILDKMYIDHDMQLGDVLNLVYGHTKIHNPKAIEEYLDGSNPIMYYGPKEGIQNGKRKKS